MTHQQEGIRGQETEHWRLFIGLFQGVMLLFCGFFTGWYWKEANAEGTVRIELVQNIPKADNEVSLEKEEEMKEIGELEECLYVASKNSRKYHNPESGPAKRIKQENKICFSSAQEAEDEGYEPGTL